MTSRVLSAFAAFLLARVRSVQIEFLSLSGDLLTAASVDDGPVAGRDLYRAYWQSVIASATQNGKTETLTEINLILLGNHAVIPNDPAPIPNLNPTSVTLQVQKLTDPIVLAEQTGARMQQLTDELLNNVPRGQPHVQRFLLDNIQDVFKVSDSDFTLLKTLVMAAKNHDPTAVIIPILTEFVKLLRVFTVDAPVPEKFKNGHGYVPSGKLIQDQNLDLFTVFMSLGKIRYGPAQNPVHEASRLPSENPEMLRFLIDNGSIGSIPETFVPFKTPEHGEILLKHALKQATDDDLKEHLKGWPGVFYFNFGKVERPGLEGLYSGFAKAFGSLPAEDKARLKELDSEVEVGRVGSRQYVSWWSLLQDIQKDTKKSHDDRIEVLRTEMRRLSRQVEHHKEKAADMARAMKELDDADPNDKDDEAPPRQHRGDAVQPCATKVV